MKTTIEVVAKEFFKSINSVKHCLLKDLKTYYKPEFLNYHFSVAEYFLQSEACNVAHFAMHKISAIKQGDDHKFVVDKKTIEKVLKTFSKKGNIVIEIDKENNKIIFKNENNFVESNLINLKYPNIISIFDGENQIVEKVKINDKNKLMECLKEIDKKNKKDFRPVRLEFKNNTIALSDIDKKLEFKIDVNVKNGSSFKVFHNSKRLIKMLSNVKEKEIEFKFLKNDFVALWVENSNKNHIEILVSYKDLDEKNRR